MSRGCPPRHLRVVSSRQTGATITLTGRGATHVRDIPGPAGAPVVLLLHGWTATADLNWASSFDALSKHYRVIALDHRGHGRGIRSSNPFTLEACADDAAALLRHLGIPNATVVGYSMGGPIAQLLWQRHPALVSGLVLCATSDHFVDAAWERLLFTLAPVCARLSRLFPLDAPIRAAQRLRRLPGRDGAYMALAAEALMSHHWPAIVEGAVALGRFDSRPWLGEVDVPTAAVLTTRDRVVPTARQRAMGASVRGASIYEVSAGHDVCINGAALFVPQLLRACSDVTTSVNETQTSRRRHFTHGFGSEVGVERCA